MAWIVMARFEMLRDGYIAIDYRVNEILSQV